jgi:hypothetical protein
MGLTLQSGNLRFLGSGSDSRNIYGQCAREWDVHTGGDKQNSGSWVYFRISFCTVPNSSVMENWNSMTTLQTHQHVRYSTIARNRMSDLSGCGVYVPDLRSIIFL